MDFAHFLKTIDSPALHAVASHWHEARGAAPMPSWEKLKPSRIARHLPILWSYRYEPSLGQFVGRLAGHGVSWGFGRNFRGVPLRELRPAGEAEQSHRAMMRIISGPVIYRRSGGLFHHGGRTIEGERIALPLAGDGIHGDGVLGASVYHHPLRSLEHGPVELLSEGMEWFSVS